MKRLLFIALFLVGTGITATLSAQNYIVVKSEDIFTSIDAYNTAISNLNDLAKQYQDQADAKFAEVDSLYNVYMSQQQSLSAATRQAREAEISAKEQAAQQYQNDIFGQDGTLMKQRVSLIQPIQTKVFAAITAYAQQVGADIVLDASNNPSLLYTNPTLDRTQQVIALLKK